MQFQLSLTTGVVTFVWLSIDGNATSTYGSAHLIGYSPAGPSLDPGSINLALALPIATGPDISPLTLSASPAPVAGSVVTYATSHIPEIAPGVHLGLHILNLGQTPAPGLDLGLLGAPGCLLHVAAMDLTQTFLGAGPTQSVTFPIPSGVPNGTMLFSQSVALAPGVNAFGLLTSNGIASRIGPY